MFPKRQAFTLIELLIVVAIIGILAAIAVPNFIEAMVRAKIARTVHDLRIMRDAVNFYHQDTGMWLIDGNDCDGRKECCFQGRWFGVYPSKVGISDVGTGENHFSGQIYQPLTTPVAYLNSIPVDPFASGCFYAYEDAGCANGGGSFGLLSAAGPDRDNGDWHGTNGMVAYQTSNGLASNGDLWHIWPLRKDQTFRIKNWLLPRW